MKPLKPNYDSEAVQAELVEKVCSYFGRIYDDDEQEKHALLRGHHPGDELWLELMGNNPTIRDTANEFNLSVVKVRRLLITGGCYDTEQYRKIQALREKGMNLSEIGEKLGVKPITVRSYLPYEKVIYNLEERSVTADRIQRFKKRWGGYKKKG